MKRLRRFKYPKQLMFMGFLGLIVVIGAGLGLYTRNQRENAPQRSLEALYSNLTSVLLATSALQSIDGASDTSPYSIATTQASLKESLDASQHQLNEHRGSLKDSYRPLKDALDEQSKRFEEFQAGYKVLGKAIYYNPSLDLEGLNFDDKKEELSQRARAASDNLDKLAASYKDALSEEAYDSLVNTAACFKELADIASGNTAGNLDTVRNRCINTYPTTRKYLVSELMQPFSSDKSKQNRGILRSAVEAFAEVSK